MEHKQTPSNKKLISIQEANYHTVAENSTHQPKKILLEILQKSQSSKHPSQKVLVSIKPKAPNSKAIKALYLAEKSRYHTKKSSEKSRSRLAIGDHSTVTTNLTGETTNTVSSLACSSYLYQKRAHSEIIAEKTSTSRLESSTEITKWSDITSQDTTVYKQRSAEKCYVYTQPQLTMTYPKVDKNFDTNKCSPRKVDIGTLVITNTPSEDILLSPNNIITLNKRIEDLERKILKQEMVFRSVGPKISLSSSDEESRDHAMTTTSSTGQPGCSYVEYSHIPETSAFQRYSQQPSPLSPSKTTTIQKEHNSEQYGRNFTLYDGITARGRRQCASVPCKRDDASKMAADRVHKIRHQLNPVRDYRLMDTVHYLAQGEFAPRDDGIKLTPSREDVLSDIIWEDVCRTHWPNTRFGRRVPHPERYGTRSELQRLIDSLLRERVAHVERRRRRHYRIVKLNHRHENCRPVGKTGDIIVASHKTRSSNEGRKDDMNDHRSIKMVEGSRNTNESKSRRKSRSRDRLPQSESRHHRHFREEDCPPGPSYVRHRSKVHRDPTCCYHTLSPPNQIRDSKHKSGTTRGTVAQVVTSESSTTTNKARVRNPRLVIKKNSSRKNYNKEEPNLEHFILLPTLVVKTPSNMKRQKKFNELYHRILNVQLNKAQADSNNTVETEKARSTANRRDVGLNINVTLSNSEENFMK
ncbi:unnamed protein product, partial [Brenthis ino]